MAMPEAKDSPWCQGRREQATVMSKCDAIMLPVRVGGWEQDLRSTCAAAQGE